MGSKSLKRIGAGIMTGGLSEVARPTGLKSEKVLSDKNLKRGGVAFATGGLSETVRAGQKASDKVVDTIVPKLPDVNDFLPTEPGPEAAPDPAAAVDEQAQVRFRSTIDQQRRRKGRRSSVLSRNRRSLTASSQDQGAATLG